MEGGMTWIEKLTNMIGHTIYNKKPLPKSISDKYQMELDALHNTLVEHGVKVHRLDPIEPLANESDGLIQMFARDPAMAIGKLFIFGNLQIPMRNKEHRGFESLIPVIQKNGFEISAIDHRLISQIMGILMARFGVRPVL